jgi:hypothetical protein
MKNLGQKVELVVSAYRADLQWLNSLTTLCKVIVYDKAEEPRILPSNFRVESRLNQGKLDESFLHHIVENYDNLADWTAFVPDNAPLKIRPDQSINDILIPGNSVKIPGITVVREWGANGRLCWDRWTNRPDKNGTNWTERYYSGKIKHAELSFVDWARKFVGFDPNGPDPWPGYVPGAIFGVPKAAITYLPKEFYVRLREQLSHHVEPEEGHYMERLWLVVFTGKAKYVPDESLDECPIPNDNVLGAVEELEPLVKESPHYTRTPIRGYFLCTNGKHLPASAVGRRWDEAHMVFENFERDTALTLFGNFVEELPNGKQTGPGDGSVGSSAPTSIDHAPVSGDPSPKVGLVGRIRGLFGSRRMAANRTEQVR